MTTWKPSMTSDEWTNATDNTAHCTNRAESPVFIGLLRSAVLSRHCTNTALTLHRHCLQGNALQLQQYNKSVPILKKLTYSCPIILRSSFAYYWAFAPDLLQIPHVFAHDLRQKPKNIRNYWLSLLIRLTTTFTITSFSSVRLSAIINVRATRVLSAIRFLPSAE